MSAPLGCVLLFRLPSRQMLCRCHTRADRELARIFDELDVPVHVQDAAAAGDMRLLARVPSAPPQDDGWPRYGRAATRQETTVYQLTRCWEDAMQLLTGNLPGYLMNSTCPSIQSTFAPPGTCEKSFISQWM